MDKKFEKYDKDNSGFIDEKELQRALPRMFKGHKFSKEYVNTILKQFDANNDGVLDPEEFSQLCAFVKASPPPPPEESTG